MQINLSATISDEIGNWPKGFKYVCETCVDAGRVVGTNNLYRRTITNKWPKGSLFYDNVPLCNQHGKLKNFIMIIDNASLGKLQLLHPKLRDIANTAYLEACRDTPPSIHPYIIQSYRSFAESDHDYQLGRTIVNPDGKTARQPMGNIITNAPGGHSWHNYGLAFDFAIRENGVTSWVVNKNWMIVVNTFQKYGFNWGGNFPRPDEDHLENKLGQTIKGLLNLHIENKLIFNTPYVNF